MRLSRIFAAAVVLAVLSLTGCADDDPAPAASSNSSHSMTPTSAAPVDPAFARQLADARAATAKYVADLSAAEKDGYQIITKMMPEMGYHYLNPAIQGFDVTKPPILVYVKRGNGWQLGAIEWVFPQQPSAPPLPGATYGSFDAACHYKDGTFVAAAAEKDCAKTGPEGGAPFNFWHPKLTTLHVWLWYHNPAGIYNGTNPLVQS